MENLIYLNRWAALHGPPGIEVTDLYRAAVAFFDCGLVDRTGAFAAAPSARVLDPLEEVYQVESRERDFSALCRLRADELLTEAEAQGQELQVLWSGGIDSTAALIALIERAAERGSGGLLEVAMSLESIREYPKFYQEHIHEKIRVRPIASPVSDHLDERKLVVTGEHGDQLFGSHHLEQHVETGLAFMPWRTVLPLVAVDRLKREKHMVEPFIEAITPVMEACPEPVETLFDFYWWANLTLKWQTVALRVSVSTEDRAKASYSAIRHFFRAPIFQRWSIFERPRDRLASWREYKMPAKRFIFDFTKDQEYLDTKTKVPSLKEVFDGEKDKRKKRNPWDPEEEPPAPEISRQLVYMMDDFVPRRAELPAP